MMNEVREMMAFRRGQGPNAEVRQEANDQMQNLAEAAQNVQQRLQEGGDGEVRALAASAEQFAAINPREAAVPLQEDQRLKLQRLEAEYAVLSAENDERGAYLKTLEISLVSLKAQIIALKIKVAKTPAIHPAVPVVSGVGDRICTHMINPQAGRITDAPRSRIPTGKI